MHDLKKLRESPEYIKDVLARRGVSNPWKDWNDCDGPFDLERFFRLQNEELSLLREVESLRTRKNQIAAEFGKLKMAKEDTTALAEEVENLKVNLVDKEAKLAPLNAIMEAAALRIPNRLDDSVPFGKSEADNPLVREVGTKSLFDFTPKAHWEIGERLGILDFAAAAKLSGSRFSVLKSDGARLERALISFMLDVHVREHQFVEVLAPYLVNPKSLQGTGQLPKFREEVFKLAQDDLYLIPTAEVTVTNLHRDDLLEEKDLPLKYVSYSACFRREAGSYGKDTKGLIRNHQFNKVEMVYFTTPERSFADLETLTNEAEAILRKLNVPYRVISLCSGDTGFSSAKTYDLEVWMPGENRWREISSCSCFTDFQARRMNIKYKNAQGKKELVHTLNGSGLAVGRLFAAILENFQLKDGSVSVPQPLLTYMGKDKITI